MKTGTYRLDTGKQKSSKRTAVLIGASLLFVLVAFFAGIKIFSKSPVEKAVSQLQFDASVTETEQEIIRSAIQAQSKSYDGSTTVSVTSSNESSTIASVLAAYVPVTHMYSSRQSVTPAELKSMQVHVLAGTDDIIAASLAAQLDIDTAKLREFTGDLNDIPESDIAFVPADQITPDVKLLALDNSYYLDSFTKGAIFRVASFSGEAATSLADLTLNKYSGKDKTLKVNMTGVTALTRVMQKKLSVVKDPTYFSAKIGDFLADADITHVSNEVSFRAGCQYSNVLFCSPPEFIETLKDSGVDLVELTGNHNNDNGSTFNTSSIELYKSLGWNTYGGGINADEAAKPYITEAKGNNIAFIAYNMADGAGSGAIAGATTAGANYYTADKAKADIEAAKQNSQFVIVNVQYAECQAYPAGYVEFPQCDGTIGGQEAAFRNLIDLGADMVVGSSAHQPQTYETYKGEAIYYGLGNLYFEQTQWPGTERGIILSHYFTAGKLLQTKLTPTVYDRDFQTRVMDEADAVKLLDRLNAAR